MNFNVIFFTKFDGTAVHDAGTETGQFEHFIVADLVHFYGFRKLAQVGGVDAVNIGVNFAMIGTQCRRQRHGTGIGAAAAKCGDVAVLVDALKARNDADIAVGQLFFELFSADALDAGLAVNVVCDHLDLLAGKADCFLSHCMKRYRHQRNGLLFACAEQHIHLSSGGVRV